MAFCISCGKSLVDGARFCASCGAPATTSGNVATLDLDSPTIGYSGAHDRGSNGSDLPTLDSPAPPSRSNLSHRPASGSGSRPPSSSPYAMNEGVFLPGRLLLGRYRIIALLGRGGMGEVYRADDLTLGQPVALKFLPDIAARDEALLERFRNEVRMARRVSHPNVCRVYDVGEVDGHTFFTMEYVDGEDLASLLRRIGRLPQDKAIDMARQLCAGLAAAHAKGVLHRDLKPANIMLDGRGQVVITDFGLAGVADQISGNEVRSGTPAYMSPEQLAGKEVSTRSDIYALGLVLYEVFTGKRAFAETSAVRLAAMTDRTPSRPSTVVKDLDPVVERVILRCLEEEPTARPANVISVAAALPGGDPLAAALAAGETPSPQMVAAAGENIGLRPRVALLCFLALIVGLGVAAYLAARASAYEKMTLELTPEVLTQKAHEIVAKLGYGGRPVDSGYGFYTDDDYVEYVQNNDKPRPDWTGVLAARPSPLQYWYRQSPQYLSPTDFHDLLLTPGVLERWDPRPVYSGMINVELDPQGRLTFFLELPPEKDEQTGQAPAPDWNLLFTTAGLDISQFQPAAPQWNSLAAGDTRAAWTGVWPGTKRPLRIEAASWRGKPVFFSLIGEWSKAIRMSNSDQKSFSQKVQVWLKVGMLLSLLVGAGSLARKNYRRGRGDREGALRLACVMFGLEMLLWLCRSHLTLSGDVIGSFFIGAATGLLVSGITWMLYLALEPWVRRYWPRTVITWSRALSGQFRDPLVGRDILFGTMLGIVWLLIFRIRFIPMMHLGVSPDLLNSNYLLGGRLALGTWLSQVPSAIFATLQFFFLLLGLKVLLRKEWIAAIMFVALFTLLNAGSSSYRAVEVPASIVIYGIAVLVVLKFGLVPLAVGIFTVDMLGNVPLSQDFSFWFMPASLMAVATVVALAAWGFYHSLGGAPLWKPQEE